MAYFFFLNVKDYKKIIPTRTYFTLKTHTGS
jgi:hypothetical protein